MKKWSEYDELNEMEGGGLPVIQPPMEQLEIMQSHEM